MKVWGVSVSYYTGKLEAYLRYKGIPYEMDHPFADQARIRGLAGAVQVPMVERDDGRWMSDSTPIIQHFENEFPEKPVLPSDPVVRFIALLIEDYADEWLWRSAMHYRWSYEHDRELLSRILADEVTTHVRLPRFVRRYMVKTRQRTRFVINDGVTDDTREHVEAGFFNAMRAMQSMLQARPYLLGNTPSIADIGLMGPMLRHFGQDPTPAAIMRNNWPDIAEWVARVWNAHATAPDTSMLNTIPDDAAPLLKEIAETHMVQQKENALAFRNGQSHFEMAVQGCHYKKLPVSRYRVYCLERLREHFQALNHEQQGKVKSLLPHSEYDLIWKMEVTAHSNYDVERQAPFNKAINVFE
ncbi:MAG: glutathione S-transferase family protein [Parvibaculum sp.]